MSTLVTQKFWKVSKSHPKFQRELSQALNISPIIAQILINRGITTSSEAEAFLSSDLSRLHDPFLLKDMDKAVQRIQLARDRKERVLKVTIGQRPQEPTGESEQTRPGPEATAMWRGISVMEMTPQIAQRLDAGPGGVVVAGVQLGTPAFEAGLRPGDVIREINRREINTLEEYKQATQQAAGPALIKTTRGYLVVNPA